MSPRLLALLPALFAASLASAQQYDPYGYPPPPPAYPQTAPGIPPLQGPVLAIPVLQADLIAKAGSDTVHFGRDTYVLTPQSQATLTAQAQWLIAPPVRPGEHRGPCRQPANPRLCAGARRAARRRGPQLSDRFGSAAGAASDRQLGQGTARDRRRPRRDLATEQPRRDRLEAVDLRRRSAGATPSQARAWRCASAISRAVISIAISARHCWPRVQPLRAARLNHLCASTRSTGTPPRPVE